MSSMFTGLIQALAPVTRLEFEDAGARMRLDLGEIARGQELGASIAVAGCCLTVVRFHGTEADFDLSPETIDRTWFRSASVGQLVNVEAALRAGDALGGHFVSGHVDGLGRLIAREPDGDYEVQTFQAPPEILDVLVPKGSVTIDGVSLTVSQLGAEGEFQVALIPETLSRTTLGKLPVDSPVHMEGDILGKFVHAYLERRGLARQTTG